MWTINEIERAGSAQGVDLIILEANTVSVLQFPISGTDILRLAYATRNFVAGHVLVDGNKRVTAYLLGSTLNTASQDCNMAVGNLATGYWNLGSVAEFIRKYKN